MRSYICSRCHTKGPVLLLANQVCKSCQSTGAWASFGDNRVIVIHPKVESAEQSNLVAEETTTGGKVVATWALLLLSMALTASVIALLVYFFRDPPPAISPEQILNRFNSLATRALILGGLAILTSTGVYYYAKHTGNDRRPSIRFGGLIVLILAIGVFTAATFCWSKTEIPAALAAVQTTSVDAMTQRLYRATTLVQTLDPGTNRYRSTKRAGIIIGTKSGRTWILTVPDSSDFSRDLPQSQSWWVNFSDGRSLPGLVRWSAPPPTNLAILQVEEDARGSEIQIHPIAEGVIPSEEVLVVPNPLHAGWTMQRGIILSRRRQRANDRWNGLVSVELNSTRADVGSGMYDRSGLLLGLNAGFDPRSGTAQFVILNSEMTRRIMAAKDSENFETLDNPLREGKP
jgi:hypothetical protein